MVRNLAIFLCFFSTLALANEHHCDDSQSRPTIAFLSPVESGSPFWCEFEEAMKEAAKQLCFDMTVERLIYEEHNRFSVYDRYLNIVSSKDKPDYFVSFLQRNIEEKSLQLFEDTGVNFISVNTGLTNRFSKSMALPRQKYKNWLAHVSPNDYQAGKASMELLIDKARRSNKPEVGNQIRALAFAGPTNSLVAQERLAGVMDAVKGAGDVFLMQALHTPWRGDEIKEKARVLIERHGVPDIIWTPTDGIALDVLDVLSETDAVSIVGGFDWSQDGIKQVQSGRMYLSTGGHFMDGAWAVVLAHDHFHKLELYPGENGVFLTQMEYITSDNVQTKNAWLEAEKWRNIDFRQYSKYFNALARRNGYHFARPQQDTN